MASPDNHINRCYGCGKWVDRAIVCLECLPWHWERHRGNDPIDYPTTPGDDATPASATGCQ